MIYKKLKNKNNNNILLNILFKSKNLYGDSSNILHKDVLPFLYGIRSNHLIINLKYVSFFIKRIYKLIQNTVQKKKNILVVGTSQDVQLLMNSSFQKNNPNILFLTDGNWINGQITNKKMNFIIKNKKIDLILIIKNSINNKFLNNEIFSLKIPIISIINTDQGLKNINYPIITNTKNIKSLYTLMYLLRRAF